MVITTLAISSMSKNQPQNKSSCSRVEYLHPIRTLLRNAESKKALVKTKVGFGIVHESD